MTTIAANLQAVRERIASACVAAGRPKESVTLLAVSKTWPARDVASSIAAGQRAFGENYLQEALDKQRELSGRDLGKVEWHFIGPLQSNKTRAVAENFDWVHSVERLKIAERLSTQRPGDTPPLQVCAQVNVSGESTKSGCAPDELLSLAQGISKLPNLHLRGLMAIPEPTDDVAAQVRSFATVRALFDGLNQAGFKLDTLSMGMSHDLEAAIMQGATMVRIGTAIFGERQKQNP